MKYLDCAREDLVIVEVLESTPFDIPSRVAARNSDFEFQIVRHGTSTL